MAFYMVQTTHVRGDEFFEEHVYFPQSVRNDKNECVKRFHQYAEKNKFDLWVPKVSHSSAGGYYTQTENNRNTLMFRI